MFSRTVLIKSYKVIFIIPHILFYIGFFVIFNLTGQFSNSSALERSDLTTLVLPISIYILDDAGGDLSSTRTTEQLREIFEKVNRIWSQAGITIRVRKISRLAIPSGILQDIAKGNYNSFLKGLNQRFTIQEPSLLNAFYARSIGWVNGRAVASLRMFFVTDYPSVHHQRVTSHEIGHILGLSHAMYDTGTLMYSGTNGVRLSKEEIEIARQNAELLLESLSGK